MLSNRSDYFFMNIIGNQATAHQKKIDWMFVRTSQQCVQAVLLNFIGIKQNGKGLPARYSISVKNSLQALWEPSCGIAHHWLDLRLD